MHTLLKHKEFILGMTLGNCPSPDNQNLIEVIEAAKEVGITGIWVCTCEPSFDKWVKQLHEYCEANLWIPISAPVIEVTDGTIEKIVITKDSVNTDFVIKNNPK